MAKTETIIVRVTEEMKLKIEEVAHESRRELSDYLRLIFEDVINKKIKIK